MRYSGRRSRLLLLRFRIISLRRWRRLRRLVALPLGWIRLLILLLLNRLLIGLLPVVLLLIGRLIALLLLVMSPLLPPLPAIPLLLRIAIGAVDDLFTRQPDIPALLEP